MREKHTPGPWRIGDAGHTVFGPPNGNPSPQTIASNCTRANARLIASAPALLAALEEIEEATRMLMDETEDMGKTPGGDACFRALGIARSAIAQAKGKKP